MSLVHELNFGYADMYPNFGGVDTSTLATPDNDDQDALNEDVKIAENSSSTEASSKSVLLAILVLVLLVIFFGGGF